MRPCVTTPGTDCDINLLDVVCIVLNRLCDLILYVLLDGIGNLCALYRDIALAV